MLFFYIIFGDCNPPYPALGSNIPSRIARSKKTRTTVSLSMQGVFAASSLRKQAWRNHKEGRVVCLHQNIFTRKVTHLPPTFAIILHIPSPLRPSFWRPRPTCPHVPYLMSSSPSSRVPKSQVPTQASRCPLPTFIHSPMQQTSYIRVVLLGLECWYVLMSNDIDVMVNFEYGNQLNDEKVICQSLEEK